MQVSRAFESISGIQGGGSAPGEPTVVPELHHRIVVAVLVAIAAMGIAYVKAHAPDGGFQVDFAYYMRAAHAVAEGKNPYDSLLIYPLTAAVALVPLTPLSVDAAGVVFVGFSMGCCAYALTQDNWNRLPILMSFPALWAMSSGQWAPLVACAAVSGGFGWAAACKPTLGLAMLVRTMKWQGFALAAAFGLATLLIMPTWPFAWLTAMRSFSGAGLHHIPVRVPGGALLLLAALRWRSADGRLLIAMSLIPQSMFPYDQFALGLLARTRLEAIVWGLWSYAVVFVGFVLAPAGLETKAANADYFSYVVVWGYYLPALAVVLRRKDQAPFGERAHIADAATPAR